eukprot:3565584-Prorocentrum_lima.AAC.1
MCIRDRRLLCAEFDFAFGQEATTIVRMTRVAIAAEQAQGVELGKTANATPAASFGDPTPQPLSTSLRTLSFSKVMKELTASRVASEISSMTSPELADRAGKSPKAIPWERLAVVCPTDSGAMSVS